MKYIHLTKVLALSASVGLLSACGESIESERGRTFGLTASFTDAELIEHVVEQVIKPKHQKLQQDIVAQTQALHAYCGLVEQNQDANASKQSLETAFKATMASWQQIEMLQMAPLAANTNELRNNIYSWPSTATCGIDQDVAYFNAGSVNGSPYNLASRANSRKGLDALEYLLFTENMSHSCVTEPSVLNGWNDLPQQTQLKQRCDFALAANQEVQTNMQSLYDQWFTQSPSHAEKLKTQDTKETINEFATALFYLEFLKDNKLGLPLGYSSNICGNAACEANLESRFSQLSLTNIADNLAAFRDLFTGETATLAGDDPLALSFDDYLAAVGDEQTAQTILTALTSAEMILGQIQTDFATAINNQGAEFEKIEALYAQVKVITDQLKTHFIMSLSVDLPDSSAGDGD
ncbi:imelysin family protein [Catenovulum maritimum]|uniref:Imelysin-like domain-containing protein n=1 Tax=Catenovulum maritimum TaxID=1513271 RepID=A0A0J8GRT9_9ALTE|nr:imelysin family protein [Catenovulum maritimum]KMT64004.1 hypothetical protein XM47_16550 [Catenovulum maritimum]